MYRIRLLLVVILYCYKESRFFLISVCSAAGNTIQSKSIARARLIPIRPATHYWSTEVAISYQRRAILLAMLTSALLAQPAWAQSATPLEVGIIPNISSRVLLAQYEPMRKYLERVLGRPVQISTAPNWKIFQERTLALEYDLVITAAHLGRLAQLDSSYLPLLSYQPYIKGLIAFAKDRPIRDIADLQGKTLVLSNPQSLVSFRGMQWLNENGLRRDRNFTTIDTPTDDSVGNVIVRGDAIAAMLSSGEYRAIPEAIKAQVQILTSFAEVPGFVVMANPKYKPAEAQLLKDHLRKFATQSDEGKTFFANTGLTGFNEPAAGMMESMDAYASVTRKSLSAVK